MTEIIYILTNEAMPGYVKVGRSSTNIEQRVRELNSSTSVPLPFTVYYVCTVKDSTFVERQLHDAFDDSRVNPRREFFRIAPERVVAALKLAEIENITPKKDFIEIKGDQAALNEARKRRDRFNFKSVGIPAGSELTFSRDDTVRAIVLDEHKINFEGRATSLSDAAKKILGVDYPVAGTDFWMYEGEILVERRHRLEEQGELTN